MFEPFEQLEQKVGEDLFERLTPRQREVVVLMARGLNNAGIARHLGITEKSVKNYINALYQELGLDRSGDYQPRVLAVLAYVQETMSSKLDT